MKRISEKNNRILWQNAIVTLMVIVFGVILALRYDFYYLVNDDSAMEEILSGLYTGTPDGHTWFHLYPLSWCISRLYMVAPKVHWYGGFLWLCQFAGLYACTTRAMCIWMKGKKKYIAGILTFSLIVGLMISKFVIITFTMVSSMLSATAIFLMATANFDVVRKGIIKRGLPSVIFYLLAVCLRMEAALLALPFLLISGLYFAVTCSRQGTEKPNIGSQKYILFHFIGLAGFGCIAYLIDLDVIVYVIAGIGIIFTVYCIWLEVAGLGKNMVNFILLLMLFAISCGVVYGIHRAAYAGEEWKDFKKFEAMDSNIYDFGTIPNYKENEEFYQGLGLTEDEVEVLIRNNFTLSDKFDYEMMRSICEYKDATVSYRYYIYYVKKMVLTAVKQFITCKDVPFAPVLITLLLLTFICIVINKRYSRLVILILFVVGHVVCWTYLLWLGRMLERVTEGLYFIEIVLALAICLAEMSELTAGKLQVILGGLIAVGVIYAGVNRIQYFNSDTDQSGSYADKQEQARFWQETIKFCSKDPGKIYILDTYTYSAYVTPVFGPETITTTNENGVGNAILAGHWIATSPLWYEKLDKLCGASSLQEVYDTGRKCCFLVDSMWLTEELQSYLKEHYPEMEIVRKDHR